MIERLKSLIFRRKGNDSAKNDDGEKLVPEQENAALVFVSTLAVLGIIGVCIYAFQTFWTHRHEKGVPSFIFSVAAILLLVAGASFVIGGLMGFLFGIPRQLSAASDTPVNGKYAGNDNLLQVSDWLTKIIVGVGLTQLMKIPGELKQLGTFISDAGGVGNTVVCSSVVVYFGVCGLLMSYLWTRLYFIKMITDSDSDVQSDMENMKNQVKLMKEYMAVGVQQSASTEGGNTTTGETTTVNDDPQKGQWGGQAKANGREIKAKVKESNISKDYFNVELIVKSDTRDKPLKGEVQFHLHPTFRNPSPKVKIENGEAKLNLLVWGAFTVGVTADDGATKLELDLSELSDAPEEFKSR